MEVMVAVADGVAAFASMSKPTGFESPPAQSISPASTALVLYPACLLSYTISPTYTMCVRWSYWGWVCVLDVAGLENLSGHAHSSTLVIRFSLLSIPTLRGGDNMYSMCVTWCRWGCALPVGSFVRRRQLDLRTRLVGCLHLHSWYSLASHRSYSQKLSASVFGVWEKWLSVCQSQLDLRTCQRLIFTYRTILAHDYSTPAVSMIHPPC